MNTLTSLLQFIHRSSERKSEVGTKSIGLPMDGADSKFFKKIYNEVSIIFDFSSCRRRLPDMGETAGIEIKGTIRFKAG
jgi:hypothetical protein